MVTIRLQRRGRKKRPIHHIVVADSRSPRDGRIVEDLGRFNNLTTKNEVSLNEERAIYWLKQGAQPSDTVRSILKNQGILYKMHLLRWGKSEEEIETALNEWHEKRAEKQEKAPSKKERQRAMLEAEEKEYQKQLKKKAEEAAKEKAKQEALAAEEDEEAEKSETADVKRETAEEPAPEKEKETKAEAQTEDEETEKEVEAPKDDEKEVAEESKVEAEKRETSDVKLETVGEEPEAETKKEDEKEEQPAVQVSTDMLAKEAIDHIENTPIDELKGFVTDNESRVTVQRAWEEKQGE